MTFGIYEVTAQNTPGVGAVLAAHGLAALPEAHCYLTVDGERFDVTRADADGAPIGRFLVVESIRPAQVTDYKTRRHRAFLDEWFDRPDHELTLDEA